MAETPIITQDDVRAIAELARLALTEDEVTLYADQLANILAYFQKLQTVDTSHIEPTASVLPLKNILRPDQPEPALPPEAVTANAAEAQDHQFRVRAVLGDE